MGEVAVVHMDLMSKGGGEAVCMNVLEALQDDHDVTLITLTDPDIGALNEYFNTDVDDLTVRRAGWIAPTINEAFGIRYYVLQNALLGRYARRHADEYDLLFSTINELGLESDSIQYIHFPFDWTVSLDNREHIFHPTVEEESFYERVCTRIAGVTRSDIRTNTLLANSEWTADVVEDAYGTRPRVLYPPIDTDEFSNRPLDEREDGLVTVGRIERSKRIDEMIRIVDGVRERGYDTHLHVIGPTVDEEYYAEVEALADEREYVYLEGELPRSELIERICTHKYGIHGKEYEHFGMAVAELAAGGAIPFVPSTGGQHAIVRDRDEQLYESRSDAIEKIVRVIDDPALQRNLRMNAAEIERRFGRERFKAEVTEIVEDALSRPSERLSMESTGSTGATRRAARATTRTDD
ncbi:glycosyltransferase family 4 protein [Halegenticoccus soli]|uniref:glycosyltransferase family 4 protein n=1 Tax=Halegenticoccus soli TaxID=1985678 RepID=UPI000C6D22F8|nr:glycosyltransferase family 4 protein [Halegenticoccus soli]